MTKTVDNIIFILIPIYIIGLSSGLVPFPVVLATLLIRLCTSDKHTVGFFLLLYGGQIGSCIRFELPFIPIYGLILIFIGLWLMRDMLNSALSQRESTIGILVVLLYFFLSYILSSNVGERHASNKIWALLQNGIFMYFGYFVFSKSLSINAEKLCQCLFLSTLLFMVHDMALLNIAPTNLFDFEWLRSSTERFTIYNVDDPTFNKFVGYQPVGMAALYGYAIFLSKTIIKRRYLYYYSIIAMELTLLSGARQAAFGFFIIAILRYVLFDIKSVQGGHTGRIIRTLLMGGIGIWISLIIIQSLGVSYLSDTLEFGDIGREELVSSAWSLFFQYPIFGTGIGGFQHHTHMLYPHNFFAELMCECGIFGALFLSIMIYRHFKKQQMSVLYITRNNSFLFLVVSALVIRVMVSDDLSASVELFSAAFACTKAIQDSRN